MNSPRNASSAGGHMEALPDGTHRWVPDAPSAENSTKAGAKQLDYANPRQEDAETCGGWWKAPIAFVLGVPAGFALAGVSVSAVWPKGSHATSPGMAVMAIGLALILAGGGGVHAKCRFRGWLGMGAGLGACVAGAFMEMFWGWHGS